MAGWVGGGGWLDQLKIEPAQPQLSLGLGWAWQYKIAIFKLSANFCRGWGKPHIYGNDLKYEEDIEYDEDLKLKDDFK